MYNDDDLYQDSYYPDDDSDRTYNESWTHGYEEDYIDYDDYEELSWDDYEELSWDDYEKFDNWPNLTLWQKIKNYLWRPIMWYREKTGYYDDIPF